MSTIKSRVGDMGKSVLGRALWDRHRNAGYGDRTDSNQEAAQAQMATELLPVLYMASGEGEREAGPSIWPS
jgi:hypothetical protein